MKKVSDSEMKVLEVLWKENKAMSIAEMNEILNENEIHWAYRTVATFLRRLHTKEIVGAMKKGITLYYYPLCSKEEFKEDEARKFVNTCFKGSLTAFLSAFAQEDKLTDDELRGLKDWFDKLDD